MAKKLDKGDINALILAYTTFHWMKHEMKHNQRKGGGEFKNIHFYKRMAKIYDVKWETIKEALGK